MDFASIFKADGWTGDARGRFEGFACAFFEGFVDFGPFGLSQDAAIEPLLLSFL